MADQPQDQPSSNQQGWMGDVQRALALILIVTLAAVVLATVAKIVWIAPPDDVLDMAKTLTSALVNMGLIALGFFFGSNVTARETNRGQQSILERLTPTPTPTPAAPVPPWWARLTEAEKNTITAASDGLGGAAADPRVKAFITASQVGAATSDDLDYLVSRGLLTAERAAAIKAP